LAFASNLSSSPSGSTIQSKLVSSQKRLAESGLDPNSENKRQRLEMPANAVE
jgi:hypothetical protein